MLNWPDRLLALAAGLAGVAAILIVGGTLLQRAGGFS